MKKIFFFGFLAFLGFAPHVFAQGFTALAPIPGLTDASATSVIQSAGLASFFNNLYKYLIGLAATLAVIEIVWAGIEVALNRDDVSKLLDSKGRIYNAIFGLILVLSPYLVFSIINPSILNLSLNLPPINLTTTPAATGGTGTQTTDTGTTTATTAGCTVTGALLKTALCPDQLSAQAFADACPNNMGHLVFWSVGSKATCGTAGAGPYQFADTSTGFLATITGYSNYEPLASNGSAVLQFASTCTANTGTTCLSSVKTPCPSLILSGGSVSCWSMTLSCSDGNSGTGGCSSNPQFTVIQ